ncbi:MAG: ABC transporter ATP-binding protein [Armatimonadota bacterium]|nr:ABC transporter ATP-binding protein [Armatimonadota bacterium]
MAQEVLLELRGVTKRFGGVVAVDNVTASIAKGEMRALIGPNGSGKTTLLNLISGLYPPDSGAIVLEGRRIDPLPPHEIAALGVARTFQIPKVFRSMTVKENLLTAGAADHRKESLTEVLARAEWVLRLTMLEALADAPASTLSGGQTVLLQLGRGLMQDPLRLFLLDEPFAGVHPALKEQIIGVIQKIYAELGVTILLVSHEMPTVRMLCHRVSVMSEGKWIAEGTLEEVAREPGVIEAYLGRAVV